MRRRTLLSAATLAGLLAACRNGGGPQGGPQAERPIDDPQPRIRKAQAKRVGPEELRLPIEMTPMIVVDPGWSAAPQQLDGIFLGYQEGKDHLTYTAVAQDGTLLWEADRPRSCTGFTFTRGAGNRALAVLADAAPARDAIAQVTLTAYDLRTAERVWGPVEAPGAQAAVGLVVAEPTDQPMGAGGPRTALSARDGKLAAKETDLDGGRILAEHLGTILTLQGTQLVATDSGGKRLWRHGLPGGWDTQRVEVSGTIDTVSPLAALSDQKRPGIILDLARGTEIATGASAVARDEVNEVIVAGEGKALRGLGPDGEELWRHEDREELDLISAGERLAYAVRRDEGTLVVIETEHGRMVQPYDADSDAPLAMPVVFSADAAAGVQAGSRQCLVTTEIDPEYGMREQ